MEPGRAAGSLCRAFAAATLGGATASTPFPICGKSATPSRPGAMGDGGCLQMTWPINPAKRRHHNEPISYLRSYAGVRGETDDFPTISRRLSPRVQARRHWPRGRRVRSPSRWPRRPSPCRSTARSRTSPSRSRPTLKIRILTRDDQEALALIRHDAAHVMAEAVQELYPGTQVTIGPVIENGFYYDFARDEPFTPEDLPVIEAKMREIIARDSPFSCEVMDRERREEAVRRQGRNVQARADRRHPRRRRDQDLLAARMARPLPRPAYDLDRQGRQGLQALEDRRRLLARGFDKAHAPAHLRHGLGERRRARSLSPSARRGREARPSPLGPRDGPVPFPGRGARCRVLASEGLGAVPGADRLYAPAPAGLGLCRGELARHARPRVCGSSRAIGRSSPRTCTSPRRRTSASIAASR